MELVDIVDYLGIWQHVLDYWEMLCGLPLIQALLLIIQLIENVNINYHKEY